MDNNDVFYRAFELYKQEFKENRDDYLVKKAVNSRKQPDDYLVMEEADFEVFDDWIKEIEKGIVYINKAILEDRQFIRNEGEVLPIEKIRRVSKDSISDLAKHSDYITRMPEEPGDTVIPEKLLMITRENDYLIYENRVVYATLSYLKDFISVRLDKIRDSINKYEGKCQIKKRVDLGYRSIDFVMNLTDIRKNDPIAEKKNKYTAYIARVEAILNAVIVLLKTPLMVAVSKAPLVTRPITKTNVLKMNTNFKETLALFDYVSQYSGDGFNIIPRRKTISPLSTEQQNSFTDIVLLSSFLTYEYNNVLTKRLNDNYIAENRRRQEIIDSELLKHIEELRNKAHKSEKDIGQYLYDLEQGYDTLKRNVEEAKEDVKRTIEECEEKIEELKEDHQNEIMGLEEVHKAEKEALIATHEEEINTISTEYENKIENINSDHNKQIEAINVKHEEEMQSLNKTIEEKNESMDVLSKESIKIKEEASAAMQEADQKVKEMEERLALVEAENLALKIKLKQPAVDPHDYTSKERFDELEKEKEILDKFFEKAWSLTKKEIKKKHANDYKKKK